MGAGDKHNEYNEILGVGEIKERTHLNLLGLITKDSWTKWHLNCTFILIEWGNGRHSRGLE
jgi:hypothetical protein